VEGRELQKKLLDIHKINGKLLGARRDIPYKIRLTHERRGSRRDFSCSLCINRKKDLLKEYQRSGILISLYLSEIEAFLGFLALFGTIFALLLA
jgi:hypothetical protein